jgi:hypothetical protein
VAPYIGDVVGLRDDTIGPDQIREAFRKARVLVVGFANHLVGGADTLVDVGQQRVREFLGVSERLVVFRGIERCAENTAVGVGKVLGTVTQSLSLNRSTRGGGLRVPPEQHPVSGLIGEGQGVAVLVWQCEGRGGGACLQHGWLRSS